MGRNRRRNKYSGSRSSSSNGSASSTFSQEGPSQEYNSFNRKDKKKLFRYLRDYYNGAFRVFNGKSNQNKSLLSKSDTPIIIGGHAFPKLTNEVLRQPYLALPKGLSSKQRRTVHEICCDGKIFEFSNCFVCAITSALHFV